MGITDELREFSPGIHGYKLLRPCDEKELRAIADRIDAEHEKAVCEAYDKGMGLAKTMTEFQELTQDAPNFVSMERGELVAYAYGMFAAGTKANAENAKLREELDDQASYDQILSDILCQQTELCIKAEADNAKLWELSSIMLKCIMANERKKLICWECPMHKQFDELRSYCCLEQEAKKLGIEE